MLLIKLEQEMYAGHINASEKEDAFDEVAIKAYFEGQILEKL